MDAQRVADIVGDRNDEQAAHDGGRRRVADSNPMMSPMLVTMADVPPNVNARGLSIAFDSFSSLRRWPEE
jgi:hypothetical protein